MKEFANIFRLVLCVSVLALTNSRALAGSTVTVGNVPLPVQGTVSVDSVGSLPPVTGTVNVSNLPATQAVSGTVSVSNLPSVSGTVNVGNTASSPVPTQNVGGGAATQVGQPASNLVNLACFPSGGTINGNCEQFSSNGTFLPGPYLVPSGKVLVLTDVDWALFNSPIGSTTTAIVAATGTTITATTGTQMAAGNNSFTYMQGYLVPSP